MSAENAGDWPWTDKEKQNYVWRELKDLALKNGRNDGTYFPLIVCFGDDEFAPTLLSKSDQRVILQDLAAENKIRLLDFEQSDSKTGYPFVILETQRTKKSPYSLHIRSIPDLVKNIDLRGRVVKTIISAFGVFDAREIKATQSIQTDVLESDEALLMLMDELGLTTTNWDSLKRQTHRTIGSRYVEVFFHGDKAKILADVISGRTSIIRPKAVEQATSLIKELMSQSKLNDLFVQMGVPTSLLVDNQHTKQDLVYNVILALSSTGEQEDRILLDRIFEEFAHPLTFGGSAKDAFDFQYKVTKIIRYDGFSLLGGRMHTFIETDERKMAELENKEREVDPALARAIGSVFGGNPFGGQVMPPRLPARITPPPQQAQSPKTEPQATHIHIYNENKNTQNIEIPTPTPHSIPQPSSERNEQVQRGNLSEGITPNLKWEQIEMKFNNGNDVTISYDGKQMQSNYEKMGFEDAKKRAPNTQWKLLQYMADHERFISFNDSKSITDDLKSQKKEMSQKLQKYFGIKTDPFEYIESEIGSGYLAIFGMRPENEIPKFYLGSTK